MKSIRLTKSNKVILIAIGWVFLLVNHAIFTLVRNRDPVVPWNALVLLAHLGICKDPQAKDVLNQKNIFTFDDYPIYVCGSIQNEIPAELSFVIFTDNEDSAFYSSASNRVGPGEFSIQIKETLSPGHTYRVVMYNGRTVVGMCLFEIR